MSTDADRPAQDDHKEANGLFRKAQPPATPPTVTKGRIGRARSSRR